MKSMIAAAFLMAGICLSQGSSTLAQSSTQQQASPAEMHSEAGREAHNWQDAVTKRIVINLQTAAAAHDKIFDDLITEAHGDFSRSLSLASQPIPSLRDVLSAVAEALRDEHVTITKVNWTTMCPRC